MEREGHDNQCVVGSGVGEGAGVQAICGQEEAMLHLSKRILSDVLHIAFHLSIHTCGTHYWTSYFFYYLLLVMWR